jgi:hypothetical protein
MLAALVRAWALMAITTIGIITKTTKTKTDKIDERAIEIGLRACWLMGVVDRETSPRIS